MHMYVYTCIHVDIYTYTHRYTYIHCIHKCIYLRKATCESVILTKFANATTLPPKPRACLMSVKASIIKQNIRRYSRVLNHNKQMRIASFVLQHYGWSLACGVWRYAKIVVNEAWKSNTIKANAGCFTVAAAITECWHTQFRHVRYV